MSDLVARIDLLGVASDQVDQWRQLRRRLVAWQTSGYAHLEDHTSDGWVVLDVATVLVLQPEDVPGLELVITRPDVVESLRRSHGPGPYRTELQFGPWRFTPPPHHPSVRQPPFDQDAPEGDRP